jgi:hypothetical protein
VADKIALTVVVNGTPTLVEANTNAPLQGVIVQALAQTDNSGQPPQNWELRDAAGQVFPDPSAKIGSFGFTADTRLFLNLKAGVGGTGLSLALRAYLRG